MANNERVHPELIEIALDKAEGFPFERFATDFLSVVEGRNFVPLGGMHDGGADGVQSRELHETEKSGVFYQITVEANHRNKINKTVGRLKKFNRIPKTIYYITSKQIPHIDKEEDELGELHNIVIRIRDKKYISSHINDSNGTIAAYRNHLEKYTDFLEKIGRDNSIGSSAYTEDPSVFVFLHHEVTNKSGNRKLIHSITDTLILWALRDTDHDKGIYKNRDEIFNDIKDTFPWANHYLSAHLDSRLEIMSKKGSSGREIKWHKKDKKYCLPFETRTAIKEENREDEALKIDFFDEIKLQASQLLSCDDGEYEIISELTNEVIVNVFEKQGLLLSYIVKNDERNTDKTLVISDCIENILTTNRIQVEKIEIYREHIYNLIRSIFYNSSITQRKYLYNLSRAYVLLFILKAEPKIIEYFSSMSASFNLFIGSDILVKALSERYLNEEDQVCRNMLKIAVASGMSLNLSSFVLDEVFWHIKTTNYEFINHFLENEPYITKEIARNSSKILIRAYFYAKEKNEIKTWKSYISQFISYENIESDIGREELKKYLIAEFKLKFIENDQLENVVCYEQATDLASQLMKNDIKDNEQLALSSALLVFGIYGLRRNNNESSNGSPFGFKTWWLTNQTRIRNHTNEIVKANYDKHYIMKPEFLLNFMAISPTCEQARKTLKNILPSNIGIELGHRLKDNVFHEVLSKVGEWKGYEQGRINTLISDLSDQLKSDQHKVHDVDLETMHEKLKLIETSD
ncbi:MAG: hypothetical protein ACXWTS_07170 [Methylococcaceae bacterium]